MRGLRKILRSRERALQAGPDASHPHTIVTQALGSIGFGRTKPDFWIGTGPASFQLPERSRAKLDFPLD